ncbi:uncharacterized protein B0H18DRAFT_1215474 [Fomitopsis serialis]|uniref:uncharacterized protein n=1 Tax=Fomitopsis serialis TaxID=139415 RepID=UPI00200864E5|nr:uncharacterized protein B0H18DRAFT_1215474 [Neoantrodia serialis]KAH9915525.1 hypothetical protein B0H18DRAFT_1215474 [Neoantrodia serialis]
MPPSAPSRLPLELLGVILEQLATHAHAQDLEDGDISLEDSRIARTALARCARASRSFHEQAIRILWREQQMGHACDAVLSNFDFGSVKWPEQDEGTWGGGPESDDEANDDMAVGIDPYDYPFTYKYVSGPITTEEWSRFEYYAQFVRVLRYLNEETIDPSVFFYLQQHARGKPLFLNLRELVWEHATPEVASVITPTISILRLPEDHGEEENGSQLREFGYRMRRHTFKQLLPSILERLPELEELELRAFGHEAFWFPFISTPHGRFVIQTLRTLRIRESRRALMRVALAALSTIEGLAELKIDLDERGGVHDPAADHDKGMPPVRAFANLKHLQIEGRTTGVAAVFAAIAAPGLEVIELTCGGWQSDPERGRIPMVENALSTIFGQLRRRNAASLQKLHLALRQFDEPLFLGDTAPDTPPLNVLASPLLELRHLQDLQIHQYELTVGYSRVNVPALVAAWPMLRSLALPNVLINLESLQLVSRTCPKLESLTVKTIIWHSSDIAGLLDSSPSDLGPVNRGANRSALQVLRISHPWTLKTMEPDTISSIARLLDLLYPELIPERCSGKNTPLFEGQKSWLNIMDEVEKLQLARRNGV